MTPVSLSLVAAVAERRSDEQQQQAPRVSNSLSRLSSSPLPPEFVPASMSLHATPAAAAAPASTSTPSAAAPADPSHALPHADALSPVVVRLLLGRKAAACIIGRHGECITAVRAAAAAAIYAPAARHTQPFVLELDDVRPGHTQRIASVSGALVQVQRALEGVVNLMAEKRAIGAAAAAAAAASSASAAGEPSTSSSSSSPPPPLPPPPPPRTPRRPPAPQSSDQVALRLIVPNSQLGAVMGVGGATMAELRKRTTAAIRASNENLPASQEKSLLINGPRSAVHHAVSLVVELLCRAQLAGASFPTAPYVVREAAPEQQQQQQQPQPPLPQSAAAAHRIPVASTNAAPLQLMAPPPPMPMSLAQAAASASAPAPLPFSLPPILVQLQPQYHMLTSQLHEVTLRLQQLGIQAAHQSLYGAPPVQVHAIQMEMQQLQHVYQMLQAQLAQHHQHSLSLSSSPQAAMPLLPSPPLPAASAADSGSSVTSERARRAALKAAAVNRVKHSIRQPLVLHIPSSLVGGVIGKKGHRINEVRAQSGAGIKIENRTISAPVAPLASTPRPGAASAAANDDDEDDGDFKESEHVAPSAPAPRPSHPADRTLTVSGNRIQVEMAAQLIAQLIEAQASRQQQQHHHLFTDTQSTQ